MYVLLVSIYQMTLCIGKCATVDEEANRPRAVCHVIDLSFFYASFFLRMLYACLSCTASHPF